MSDLIYINDRDINDLGLAVLDYGTTWTTPAHQPAIVQPYGTYGGHFATDAQVPARTITLGLALETTRATRVASLDDVQWLFSGLLEVRFGDSDDRVMYMLAEEVRGETRWSLLAEIHGDLSLIVRLTAANPLRFDHDASVAGFDSNKAEVPLGTAPSVGLLTIHGAATNPAVTYRDTTGTAVLPVSTDSVTIGFAQTLGADDAIEIDLVRQRIVLIENGTRTLSPSIRDRGWYFALDPMDGDGENGHWPTLEVDAGNGVLEYRRAWLS